MTDADIERPAPEPYCAFCARDACIRCAPSGFTMRKCAHEHFQRHEGVLCTWDDSVKLVDCDGPYQEDT